MSTTENLQTLKINRLQSQEQYDSALSEGRINSSEIYLTPEEVLTDVDIKLSAPFTLTQDFGYYTLGRNSSIQVGEGQTLREFLQGALCTEDKTIFAQPPICYLSITGAREGEIGAPFTPGYTYTTTNGTFKWGYMTDNTPIYGEHNLPDLYITGGVMATQGSIGSALTYSDEPITIAISGSYTREAITDHPISNIGNDIYEELPAEYKSKTNSIPVSDTATFTGYRKMFMGATSSSDVDSLQNGSAIRNNLTGFKAQKLTEKEITAAGSDTMIIWAIPSSFSYTEIKFEFELSGTWYSLTSEGISNPEGIVIPGAGSDGGELYTIFYCCPADGGTFGGSGLNTRITIK